MLHKVFEDGYWFAPKRYGLGSGLPIAWQGWALTAAYVALVAGLAILGETSDRLGLSVALPGIALATLAFVFIAHRRTRGGWRWRWGDDS